MYPNTVLFIFCSLLVRGISYAQNPPGTGETLRVYKTFLARQTPFKDLTLTFDGEHISGKYPWHKGWVEGELKNDTLKGIWRHKNKGYGAIEFIFNKELTSFRGKYNDVLYHPGSWHEWNGVQRKIIVGENVRIDIGSNRNTGECRLSIHPKNSNHLLAAVTTGAAPDDPDAYSTAVLVSLDQGKTWKTSATASPHAADPWCIILSDGSALVSDIAYGDKFKLFIYRSNDQGRSWRDSLSFGNGHDHDMLVEDLGRKMVYLVSTQTKANLSEIFLSKSSDSGKKFSKSIRFSPFSNLNFNAKTPVILSDGTLIIPLVTRGYYQAGQTALTRWEQTQSWFVSSTDGGNSFSTPAFITGNSGRRHHVLLTNPSEPWKDQLLYFYTGAESNGIYSTRSIDRGKSWSESIRIDGNSFSSEWGTATVSPEGIIGVTWLEKTDPSGKCYALFFSASADGGETFLPPVKVSTSSSCPTEATGFFGRAWPQGGDYNGMVALSGNEFMILWSDARSGKFELYNARIKIE